MVCVEISHLEVFEHDVGEAGDADGELRGFRYWVHTSAACTGCVYETGPRRLLTEPLQAVLS